MTRTPDQHDAPGTTRIVAPRRSSAGQTTASTRFFIVVVLYRMALSDSPTIRSLVSAADALEASTILVWDNSPAPQSDAALARLRGAGRWETRYVHASENVGLAAIYTTAIEAADGHDLVVLLDQDSSFSRHYLDAVRAAAAGHPECALFLPIVESHGRIVSPGHYRWIKGRYWRERRTGLIAARGLTAINSGMAVRRAYLQEEFAGYDQRLRFYGVDTFFMLDHARRRSFAYVLDSVIDHESALLDQAATVSERLERYRALFHAWMLLHEASRVRSFAVRCYALYVGARESTRARDSRFLRSAWSAVVGRGER